MGISALTPPPAAGDPMQTLLEFADNRLLVDLCGEYDRNLVKLETELGVQILHRGNQLRIMGESEARARAAETLKSLYARLSDGKPVETGDVDGALGLLREARLRAPQNREVRYHLAQALHQSGRTAEARKELLDALADGGRFPGIEDARALQQKIGQ